MLSIATLPTVRTIHPSSVVIHGPWRFDKHAKLGLNGVWNSRRVNTLSRHFSFCRLPPDSGCRVASIQQSCSNAKSRVPTYIRMTESRLHGTYVTVKTTSVTDPSSLRTTVKPFALYSLGGETRAFGSETSNFCPSYSRLPS